MKRPKILIATRDADKSFLLQLSGYEIIRSASEIEALNLVRTHAETDRNFDLLILHLQGSYQLHIRFLMSLEKHNLNIPVLVVTARTLPEQLSSLFTQGFPHTVCELCSPHELLQKVADILKRTR